MIIKVTPDKEKVKSILQLIKEREEFTSSIDHEKFSTNASENYYEIIKELANALLTSNARNPASFAGDRPLGWG